MEAKKKNRSLVHGQIRYAVDQVLEVRVEEEYGLHAYLEILDRDSRLIDEQAGLAGLPPLAYQQASGDRIAPLTKASAANIPWVGIIDWSLRYQQHGFPSKLPSFAERQLRRILGRYYPAPRPRTLPKSGLRAPEFSMSAAVAREPTTVGVIGTKQEQTPRIENHDECCKLGRHHTGEIELVRSSKFSGDCDERLSGVAVSEWPRVSVVTVSFNQAKYLPECLDSVISQNYPHLEYIVIDGGSTDGSRNILNNYRKKISTLIIEPDRGQSHALNKAFALVSGEIMNWVCSDDRLEPGALGVVAETFRRCPSDLVVGGCRVIDEESKTKSVHHSAFTTGATSPLSFGDLCSFTATWQKALYFYQPEVFFTHDLWRRSGAHVKEHLHYAMDYELFLRFALAGAKVFATRKVLGCSRQHSEQKTQHELPLYLPTVSRILRDFRDDLAALRPELCTSK